VWNVKSIKLKEVSYGNDLIIPMTKNNQDQSNFIENIQRNLSNTIDTILNHSYLDALEKNIIAKEKVEIFNINEHLLNNGEFDRYNYYFIKHYDPSKKSKIRWCPISFKNLARVTVLDYRYYQFENMIKRYLGVIINHDNNNSISEYHQKSEIFLSAYDLLQKVGFKKTHIHDKIKSNMLYRLQQIKQKLYFSV